jgi:hypothetical protein
MLKQDRAAVQFGKLKLTGFAVFHAVQIARYFSENKSFGYIKQFLICLILCFTSTSSQKPNKTFSGIMSDSFSLLFFELLLGLIGVNDEE